VSAAVSLDLVVEAGGWAALGEVEALVEISVLLADDATIRELNREWRGKDKPTNVLSFPAPEQPGVPGPRHLGDLALAFETLEREARDEDKPLADHATHLIVHGTLHLLGYDHETTGEAEIMEALEVKALARLGVADPYQGAELA
jgi:probable rRNA maturation factor